MSNCLLTWQWDVRASGNIYSSCIFLHPSVKLFSTVKFLAPDMKQCDQFSLTQFSAWIYIRICWSKMRHRAIYALEEGSDSRAIFWEELLVLKLSIWERFTGFWTNIHPWHNYNFSFLLGSSKKLQIQCHLKQSFSVQYLCSLLIISNMYPCVHEYLFVTTTQKRSWCNHPTTTPHKLVRHFQAT